MLNVEKQKEYSARMKALLLTQTENSSLKMREQLITFMSIWYGKAVSEEDTAWHYDENGKLTHEDVGSRYLRLNLDVAISASFRRFFHETAGILSPNIIQIINNINGNEDNDKVLTSRLESIYGSDFPTLRKAAQEHSYSDVLRFLVAKKSTILPYKYGNDSTCDDANFLLSNLTEDDLKALMDGYYFTSTVEQIRKADGVIQKLYTALGFPGRLYTQEDYIEMLDALKSPNLSIEDWIKYMGTYVDIAICNRSYAIQSRDYDLTFLKQYIGTSENNLPDNVKQLFEEWLEKRNKESQKRMA